MRNRTLGRTLGLALVGVFALLATPAFGKTIVVKPGDPIEDAVAQANPGDKILLKRGIHVANISIDTNRLRFVGQGRAVWDGGVRDDHCVDGEVDDTLFQNIWFVNGRDQVHIDGDRTTIRNCRFSFSGEDAIDVEGEDIKVERCRFRGIEWRPIWIDGDGAMVQQNNIRGALDDPDDDEFGGIVVRGRAPVIQRNTIKNVDGRGIMILGRDQGVWNEPRKAGDGAQILNNRITNTQRDGIRTGVFEDNIAHEVIIRGNRVTSSHEDGIEVYGDGALVERNTVRNARGDLIDIDGDDARVLKNRLTDSADDEGVIIWGDDATVADNVITNTKDECIDVNGHRCMILRNRVSNSFDNDGIEVDGPFDGGPSQGSLIERNIVTDCVDDGMSLDVANSTVRRNVVRDAGTHCGLVGIKLNNGDNTVENNVVSGASGIGILIGDEDQIVTNNRVTDCGLDGIMLWGSGHILTRNTVRGCDAEGLQNSADDVTVTRCTFLGNRLDVANDGTVVNDGTFEADNTFQSGGLDTPPEIDCSDPP